MVVWKSSDTFVEPLIKKLKSTTFFGRRFTRRQIAEVQQMVATFPALSRKELAQTICEHLHWHTPSGGNRVKAALGMLEQLEQAGILRLPPQAHPEHAQRTAPAGGPDPAQRSPAADRERSAGAAAAAPAAGRAGAADPAVERVRRAAPLPRLPSADGPAPALLPARPTGAAAGLPTVQPGDPLAGLPRRLGRLARGGLQEAPGPGGGAAALPAVPLGAGRQSGQSRAVAGRPAAAAGLAAPLRLPAGPAGNRRGPATLPRDLLPGRQLDLHRPDPGPRRRRTPSQGRVCLSADEALPHDPAAGAAPPAPPEAAAAGAAGGPRGELRRPVAGPARLAQRPGRRGRPPLVAAPPGPRHAAGDAVRVPPRVRSPPPGLHHHAGPAVGPVPRPGRAPALEAAGFRHRHVQGPAAH